jgi:4a-hydroxytetrahydrobiopterin dehydratase
MSRLNDAQIRERLAKLNGWQRDGDAIRKEFKRASFPDAVAFVSRLVPGAEAADHHPDISINYSRVTLSYSTHSEGGLTEKDFEGASMADRCA